MTSRGRVFKVGIAASRGFAIRFTDAGAEWALCLDPKPKARATPQKPEPSGESWASFARSSRADKRETRPTASPA